jgi:hypothetical protein
LSTANDVKFKKIAEELLKNCMYLWFRVRKKLPVANDPHMISVSEAWGPGGC